MSPPLAYDVAIVGAGIVGLGCALAAARRGERVVVIDRDAQANGASVRNFGFITVTGQERGGMRERALRTSVLWREAAEAAGIDILQRGLVMAARREEAVAVLEAFMQTEMGEGCRLLSGAETALRHPGLAGGSTQAALVSPHEVRVDSRRAIPALAAWLQKDLGVEFRRSLAVQSVDTGRVETAEGAIRASGVIVCPGDDLVSLFPGAIAAFGVERCKLQMMRLEAPGVRLAAGVMSDLGLVRYAGYAALTEAQALRARLQQEQSAQLEHGVHLIVVQDADGALVVGDSHAYGATPDPFSSEAVDRLILEEYAAVFGAPAPKVRDRWSGVYAYASKGPVLLAEPRPHVRLAMVTTGAGASVGFALGEEVVAELLG
jgi:FAD dependent oxidoreductase TIGR03364